MDPTVLLLNCPLCHDDWLVLDTGQDALACPVCGPVLWKVTTTWTPAAATWWPMIDRRRLALDSPGRYLRRLYYYVTQEHPSGPIGSRMLCIGMQLMPSTAPNGDTTWHFARTAGSDN